MKNLFKKIFVPLSIFSMVTAIAISINVQKQEIRTRAASVSAVYTITALDTATASGTLPAGSSHTFEETYGTTKQMTAGNSQTLTLKGWGGKKVTGFTMSMKSNSSTGSGNLTYKFGSSGTEVFVVSTNKFNDSTWNGSWSTSYVNVVKTVDFTVPTDTDLIIKIAATVNSLYCQSYTITYDDVVLPPVNVTGVSILGDETRNIVVGETLQLFATITPNDASNKNVTWASSDSSKVSVTNTGYITALLETTTPVTISVTTAEGNFTDSVAVNVSTVSATGIMIDQTDFSLIQDQTFQLTYTINPTNTTNKGVIWSSSNQSVVSVSETGLITAIQQTESTPVTITVTTMDGGFSDTISITVTPNPILLESTFGNGGENDWQVASGSFYSYFGHAYGNKTNLSLKTKNTFFGLKNRPVGTQVSVEVVATSVASPGTSVSVYGLDTEGNRIATITQTKNIRYGTNYSGSLPNARNDAIANPTLYTLPVSMTNKITGIEVTFSSAPNSLLFEINVSATLGSNQVQAEALAGLVNDGDLSSATGKCEALLNLFDAEYGLLSAEAKTIFNSSIDDQFTSAHQRIVYMEAWVAANSTGSVRGNEYNDVYKSNTIYLLLISGIGLTSVLGYRFILRRKKV